MKNWKGVYAYSDHYQVWGKKKADLLEVLEELNRYSRNDRGDEEVAHVKADKALLDFIGDEEVTKAFKDIKKWYS